MAFTSYLTIDGRIHGEVTSGVVTGYATDALGSVVATMDNSGNVQNTYRYKPYGEVLARIGTATNPNFLWNARAGFQALGSNIPSDQNNTGTYSDTIGIWTSLDILRSLYQLAMISNPVNASPQRTKDICYDPTKHGSISPCDKKITDSIKSELCKFFPTPIVKLQVSATICDRFCSKYCKCTGNLDLVISGSADSNVNVSSLLYKPCSITLRDVACNIFPIYFERKCPPGQKCTRKLPRCNVDGGVRHGEYMFAEIDAMLTDYYGIYDGHEYCLNHIKLKLRMVGNLSRAGCKDPRGDAEC